MSKDLARSQKSYANEELLLTIIPTLLEEKGFTDVKLHRAGVQKFFDAVSPKRGAVRFWLKQGWTGRANYSAIQFGMVLGTDPHSFTAASFSDLVERVVSGAKEKHSATHALLVHMDEEIIKNYVVLSIDDVIPAYREQLKRWPDRARNTRMPTLWFEDTRDRPDAECVSAVAKYELPLAGIAGFQPMRKGTVDVKKVTVEMERRMRQRAFRLAVGNKLGWRCMVSGLALRQVLDAAHLPGRDWRTDNKADDGVLLRADLHRLLDRGLAELRGNRFWIAEEARVGEYANFHEKLLKIRKASVSPRR